MAEAAEPATARASRRGGVPFPELDTPAWTGRLGGPLGLRAAAGGRWFDPVPFALVAATIVWALLMLRQLPCQQTVAGAPVNTYLRLCYSDIPVLVQTRGMGLGDSLFTGEGLEYPVGIIALIGALRSLTGLVATVGPDANAQQQLDAANVFFLLNAIVLFGCFLITVWAHLQMGRNSASSWSEGVRVRAWDAVLIAASPLVIATGLINWDFLALALTALGLLAWQRRHSALSGGLIGLAFAAKFYPLVLVPALALLCLRAGRLRSFLAFLGGGVATWLLVNVPFMMASLTNWRYFWTFNADRGPDLGSLWYVLTLAGVGITHVDVLAVLCMALGGCAVIWLVLRADRRPRLAQVGVLLLITFLVFNKVYSPQYVLWLLPFVVLARPKIADVAAFTVAELLYFLAVWGFLEGVMGPGTGPDRLYWLAVFLRIGVQLWIAWRVVRDVLEPWNDPVRTPYVDDPIGGVLDHTDDARWMREGFRRRPEPVAA